jgi:beta-N-acetylhexosaminidase
MIDIKQLSLEEKIGQMVGFAFYGTKFSEELRIQLEDLKSGLVIFFKDNVGTLQETHSLIQQINNVASIPPFIALDQEGGMVTRVTSGVVQSPGAMAMSANQSTHDAYLMAKAMGQELKALGFNFNFAPVADVNNNPSNPVINVRSYSDQPNIVSEYAIAAMRGYHESGLMTSLKHFPGHGDTSVDSHVGLPTVDFDRSRMNKVELVPFMKAIEAGAPGIMSSHVRFTSIDDEFPTSMSKKVLTDLLRHQMKFDGLIVTDSLTMGAIHKNYSLEEIVLHAFNAGNDILITCGARDIKQQRAFVETAIKLTKQGLISIDRINESVNRILRYKAEYEVGASIKNYQNVEEKIGKQHHIDLAKRISQGSITLVKDEKKLIPIIKDEKTLVVFPIIKVVTLADNQEGELMSLVDYLGKHRKCDKLY